MICAGCEVDLRGCEAFLQVSEVGSEYSKDIGDYIFIQDMTMVFCSTKCLRRWY